MCRWFAYIGQEPCLLDDILVRPQHSIVKQIDSHFLPQLKQTYSPHRGTNTKDGQGAPTDPPQFSAGAASDEGDNPNPLTNIDGFGVGWYSDAARNFNDAQGRAMPTVYRNTQPALNDMNFKSLCENTQSQCVFCHIRAGTGLTPTVLTNNHPYTFGRFLFMHNGVVANFHALKIGLLQKLSAKAYANVLGTTDSEHVAALFFTHLGDDWERSYTVVQLRKAMDATLSDLLELIKGTHNPPHSSLNFAVTDGDKILAQRFSSDPKWDPPSLYYSTGAGATLNRKYEDHPDGASVKGGNASTDKHGKHVIIASEPNTYKEDDWHLVPRDSYVLVDEDMNVKVEPMPKDLKYEVETSE
ncbi:hypothetical protein HKX48_003541 [Thoreauomyces humboldtii]|nr:hypothetical protein HKX48_003541 [Thoreauomyces humboldtii]